jgi:S-methylmethionine-dependent homocysteine/selenocysteine methylase
LEPAFFNKTRLLIQMADRLFFTDGGLETTLIFQQSLNLPEFAAFDLLKDAFGTEVLGQYFRIYVNLARNFEADCVLESATW